MKKNTILKLLAGAAIGAAGVIAIAKCFPSVRKKVDEILDDDWEDFDNDWDEDVWDDDSEEEDDVFNNDKFIKINIETPSEDADIPKTPSSSEDEGVEDAKEDDANDVNEEDV